MRSLCDRRASSLRIIGDAEHAGKIVTAPPGEDAEHGAWDRPQRICDRSDHSVAAEGDDGLAQARCLDRQPASVLEITCVDASHR
jgi:hypothetical protein